MTLCSNFKNKNIDGKQKRIFLPFRIVGPTVGVINYLFVTKFRYEYNGEMYKIN